MVAKVTTQIFLEEYIIIYEAQSHHVKIKNFDFEDGF